MNEKKFKALSDKLNDIMGQIIRQRQEVSEAIDYAFPVSERPEGNVTALFDSYRMKSYSMTFYTKNAELWNKASNLVAELSQCQPGRTDRSTLKGLARRVRDLDWGLQEYEYRCSHDRLMREMWLDYGVPHSMLPSAKDPMALTQPIRLSPGQSTTLQLNDKPLIVEATSGSTVNVYAYGDNPSSAPEAVTAKKRSALTA